MDMWLRAGAGTGGRARCGALVTAACCTVTTPIAVVTTLTAAALTLTATSIAAALIAAATFGAAATGLRPATTTTAALSAAPAHNRFGFDIRVRFETRNHHLRNFVVQHAFDIAQVIALVHAHQRHRFALVAGAAGTADAVHVIFRNIRQLEVHDVRQLVDVETARGDVRRHQHFDHTLLEIRQRLGARTLALVAVNGGGADAIFAKLIGETVGAVFGAHEHQHLFPVVGLDER